MKFKFKIQQYQTDAVENTVSVFTGQPSHRTASYRIDIGKQNKKIFDEDDYTGYRNHLSIDKKTNRVIDGKVEKKTGLSDDISAYDLILKNKERLLSFEDPTRFIFSHSALREGWDNPNVFQICTLRHSSSTTAKRQEVGRGLRICVDKNGIRMDAELLGDKVHEVNKLTVIANESYADFTTALQRETRDVLRERAIKDPKALDEMVVEEKTATPDNKLNDNFDKAEFQALGKAINHQYVYTVNYDSEELIEKAILHLDAELEVKQLRYIMVEGVQGERLVTEFGDTRSRSQGLTDVCTSTVRYDLVGDIAKGANLTRRTVVRILQGIKENKLYLFKNNPEEFIRKVISIIKEQKSTMMIVEAIPSCNMTDGKYDRDRKE